MNLINFDQIKEKDSLLVGGKGASLGKMIKAGIPVPQGFVISADVFNNYKDKPLPESVQEEILRAFDKLGVERVAVRSSAIAEDSSESSWAGQLESYLNITKDNLIENIKKCWDSIKSKRAKEYAMQTKTPKEKMSLAVVIQKMIDSEAAGIIFTVNPVTKNYDEVMIEAGYGLGEMIVQGMITPDNYIIDKKNFEIKNRHSGCQEKMSVSADGGTKEVGVPEDKKNQAVLTDDQITELAEIAVKIEKYYQSPQDIEWAFEKGKFYIVQSRPITTLLK